MRLSGCLSTFTFLLLGLTLPDASLALIFGQTARARTHPFEPKTIPQGRPFFNGWCLRTTDGSSSSMSSNNSTASSSSSLILGSYSSPGAPDYTAHFIAVAARFEEEKTGSGQVKCSTAQILLPPEAVEVVRPNTRGPMRWPSRWSRRHSRRRGSEISFEGGRPYFTWTAPGLGSLQARGDEVAYDFKLPRRGGGFIHTAATVHVSSESLEGSTPDARSRRGSWTHIEDNGQADADNTLERQPSSQTPFPPKKRAGLFSFHPEGWLRRIGWLLPCRYHVHSLGGVTPRRLLRVTDESGDVLFQRAVASNSSTETALWTNAATAAAMAKDTPPRTSLLPMPLTPSTTHMEANWGCAFPSGWIWCQANNGVDEGAEKAAAKNPTKGQVDLDPRERCRADNESGLRATKALVLVGGRFRIGPAVVPTWVIGYASPFLHTRSMVNGALGKVISGSTGIWAFRTTDIGTRVTRAEWNFPSSRSTDPVSASTATRQNTAYLHLTMRSMCWRPLWWPLRLFSPIRARDDGEEAARSVPQSNHALGALPRGAVIVARELEIEASTAVSDFFSERLFVPTVDGFSNAEGIGCVESFGATVALRAYYCIESTNENKLQGLQGRAGKTHTAEDRMCGRMKTGSIPRACITFIGKVVRKVLPSKKIERILVDEEIFDGTAALEFGGSFASAR